MIPKLFEDDTSVPIQIREGIGRLPDALSCNVVEERNGQYELTMVYPAVGPMYKELQTGRIIVVKANDSSESLQAFRIYKVTSVLNGRVTVNAHHISYDLNGFPVSPFMATGAQNALEGLLSNSMVSASDWSVWTDLTNTTTVFNVFDIKSVRANLGGSDGSVLDTFGGEFEWDNRQIKLWQSRGSDNGVLIAYGKNLTDLNREDTIEATYTGVVAYWSDGEQTVYSDVQYTSNHASFPREKIFILDASQDYDSAPTSTELNTTASQYRDSHQVGAPRVNIKASFVPLWQSEEYKDLAPLEHVSLCDTVKVFYPQYDVEVSTKVIATDYDVLKERYRSVTLGDARSTLADTIKQQTEQMISASGGLRIVKARISDVAPVNGTATATFSGLPGNYGFSIVEALSKKHGESVWKNDCGITELTSSVVLTVSATSNMDFMLYYAVNR